MFKWPAMSAVQDRYQIEAQSFKKADRATTIGNLCSSAHFLQSRICGELGQRLPYLVSLCLI